MQVLTQFVVGWNRSFEQVWQVKFSGGKRAWRNWEGHLGRGKRAWQNWEDRLGRDNVTFLKPLAELHQAADCVMFRHQLWSSRKMYFYFGHDCQNVQQHTSFLIDNIILMNWIFIDWKFKYLFFNYNGVIKNRRLVLRQGLFVFI